MHLHPHLRALRDDDAPQRAAQARLMAAMKDWRRTPEGAALLAELAEYDREGAIERFPLLCACFVEDDGTARTLAAGLADSMATALAEAPLGHVPMRHFTDGTVSTLLIAAAGRTTLSLVTIDGQAHARRPRTSAVSFADNECREHILAGSAQGELIEIEPSGPSQVRFEVSELELCPGTIVRRQSHRQAAILRQVDGALVTLRLQRRPATPEPTREYALANGQLLNQAAGSARDSRFELAAALLERMGRADAAPLLAAMAQEQASESLRWQALRECLGLDTALGFAVLCQVAANPGDSLAEPAGAMRAQLIEKYPVLAEVAKCPA